MHQRHTATDRRWLLMALLSVSLLTVCGTAASTSNSGQSRTPPGDVAAAVPVATATPTSTAPASGVRPTVTVLPTSPTNCPAAIITDPIGAEDLHTLAWFSSVIVVGTVSSHSEPYTAWAFQRDVQVTDYTVRVETFVRGQPEDSQQVTVRQFGTPGGCTVLMGDPAFAVGDRVVLFLWDLGSDRVAYRAPVGQLQGVWHLSVDDIATSRDPFMGSTPLPLDELLASVRASLQSAPPTGYLADEFVVLTYDSPLGPVPPTAVP